MSIPNITEAVDAYIESVTDEREPDGMYHPSSLAGGCVRQVIYEVRGEERTDPPDAQSKRRFYIGHRLHESVQRAVESMKGVVNVYPEFEIDMPSFSIVGHGDILIECDDDEWYVVEVKSIKKWGMKKGLPLEHHVKQGKTYCVGASGWGVKIEEPGDPVVIPPWKINLKGLIVVYVEKEELEMKEYFIPYDASWLTDLAQQIVELEIYRNDAASLPPRLPLNEKGKKQWQCNYCDWRTKCWRQDLEEIEPQIKEEW